ncbi:MAG TPA: XRE family transcriptional regulator, partial [Brevundimonas diminuta]|nr:XRE family transcriptional regulator [Brevundimonas diminuta]
MGSVLGFPGIDPMDAVVGARIRRWRDRRGVAFADLAAAIDLTPEALRRVEAGR